MDGILHFQLLAQYNQRMNRQIYEACGQLSQADLTENKGAFFHSISGTLNHIMVGDLIWLNRFNHMREGGYENLNKLSTLPLPKKLDATLYENFSDLEQARKTLDQIIIDWIKFDLSIEDIKENLSYKNTKSEPSIRNFFELISHFFNHQTHHRGQVSTLLNQQGIEIGVTDFLIDIPSAN